ncbi:MAG: sialate O-acetylesterase [Cyclobacteriaceae bacterium]
MKKPQLTLLFLLCLLAACETPDAVNVRTHQLFSDHTVLQRGTSINIWGTADPGGSLEVQLAGSREIARADSSGRWMVSFPEMEAGGPYELSIEGADTTISFRDILIGDVWLASGQSNMEWPMKGGIDDQEKEIAEADYPEIRIFKVAHDISYQPEEQLEEGNWQPVTPQSVADFSAVAYFFGREIQQEVGVPVGLLQSTWGGTPAEAWTSREALADMKDFEEKLAQMPEEVSPEDTSAGGKNPRQPTVLYNAMIHPLIPYKIRGVIWYQGESNAGRATQYQTLFPLMIEDWRNRWGIGDFPFLFTQLANFKPAPPLDFDDWAELREAQLMALDLDNTGMAVTIDIGDSLDIHPRNKLDVGRRLALSALKVAYGRDNVWSGPLYESMRVQGDSAIITFKEVGDGLMVLPGEEIRGFTISGEDQKFYPAQARIISENEMSVWSSRVDQPEAVRYGWSNNPDLNLYNESFLPASPFRTDEWTGIEEMESDI